MACRCVSGRAGSRWHAEDAEFSVIKIDALDLKDVPIVCVDGPPTSLTSVSFSELSVAGPTSAVEDSLAKITGDTVARLMLTSGSTGMPKVVINTQRMMCANVMMGQQTTIRGPEESAGVMLDWMPWSHVMAGNAVFNSVLAYGSELYLDEGRPIPGMFERPFEICATSRQPFMPVLR